MKYRKKPVVIEAFHHTNDMTVDDFYEFTGGPNENFTHGLNGEIHIKTLEGTMTALPGDYIIKGVAGEFYPCKPDIFEATYKKADKSNLTVMINVDEVIERFSEKLEERLEEMLNPSQLKIDGSLPKDDVEELKRYRALEIKKPS